MSSTPVELPTKFQASEGERIAAAVNAVADFPLLFTPHTPTTGDHEEIFQLMNSFAKKFDGEEIDQNYATLERFSDLPDDGTTKYQSAVETAYEMVSVYQYAALYLGIAMGLRLAKTFTGGAK